MRFLPIKGSKIQNDKTRNIVHQRIAYHIWLKTNEITIDTNMVNIHQSLDNFDGLSFFAQVILGSVNKDNQRVFSHFNRVWSSDPSQESRWSISIKYQLHESAMEVFNNLKDDLSDKYGQDIKKKFKYIHMIYLMDRCHYG